MLSVVARSSSRYPMAWGQRESDVEIRRADVVLASQALVDE
jgi:hypothetical protein